MSQPTLPVPASTAPSVEFLTLAHAEGWTDAAGQIMRPTFCVGCRYNLQSQPIAARCPECGQPVADSAPLSLAQPADLRQVRAGLRWMAVFLVLAVGWGLASDTILARLFPQSAFQLPQQLGETVDPFPNLRGMVLVQTSISVLGTLIAATGLSFVFRSRLVPASIALLGRWVVVVMVATLAISSFLMFWTQFSQRGLAHSPLMDGLAQIFVLSAFVLMLLSARAIAALMRLHVSRFRRWLVNVTRFLAVPLIIMLCTVFCGIWITQAELPGIRYPHAFQAPPTPGATSPEYIVSDEFGRMTRTATAPAEYFQIVN